METITLKNSWSIIRIDGICSFFLFLMHRMRRHEPWLVHQFHRQTEGKEKEG
ncbi:MAG TPA: hypothetical protein VFX30_04205 [bacterium]|nr:hypothetical protein [bacterium]